MRTLLILFVLFFGLRGTAQEEPRYRAVADTFQAAYNDQQYGQIFGMFDSLMQQRLPSDKLEEFLGHQVRASVGSLQSMEYYRSLGGAHIYKSTFDRGLIDIQISLDPSDRINGLFLKPHVPVTTEEPVVLERNSTPMQLPFSGEWFVFWGGEIESQNYHMANKNQQFAYDILKVSEGASYAGDPLMNESYFAFGQDILAPCDATVEVAIDGVPDNIPGELNPIHLTGNTLVLKTRAGEYILMAHLKEGSIAVRKGQQVSRGEYLARCGNSGNSSEAHLHLQLQNMRDFHKATGARLYFETLLVNGAVKKDYMPVKEDFIQNSN